MERSEHKINAISELSTLVNTYTDCLFGLILSLTLAPAYCRCFVEVLKSCFNLYYTCKIIEVYNWCNMCNHPQLHVPKPDLCIRRMRFYTACVINIGTGLSQASQYWLYKKDRDCRLFAQIGVMQQVLSGAILATLSQYIWSQTWFLSCWHWDYLHTNWKFLMMLIEHLVNSDWLFNTQSRVLQAYWFILEVNEIATLNIKMPYWLRC